MELVHSTKTPFLEYFTSCNSELLQDLYIEEIWTGDVQLKAYHDEIEAHYKLSWGDIPFSWEYTNQKIRSAIISALQIKRNPWLGCCWRDCFLSAEGDIVKKLKVYPIGD